MVLCQGVERRTDRLGIGLDQMRCGLPMGFGLNVGGKLRGAVFDAQRLLRLRARRRNEAGRQCGRAGRECVALEHHHIHTGALQGQGRRQAAGPGAHNRHRNFSVGPQSLGRQYLHRR